MKTPQGQSASHWYWAVIERNHLTRCQYTTPEVGAKCLKMARIHARARKDTRTHTLAHTRMHTHTQHMHSLTHSLIHFIHTYKHTVTHARTQTLARAHTRCKGTRRTVQLRSTTATKPPILRVIISFSRICPAAAAAAVAAAAASITKLPSLAETDRQPRTPPAPSPASRL